jgi:hypothetical protein
MALLSDKVAENLWLIGNERGSPHIWGVKYNEKAKAKANPT